MSYIDTTAYVLACGDPELEDVADWTFVRLDGNEHPTGVPLVLPGTYEAALAVVLGDRHPDWRLLPPLAA